MDADDEDHVTVSFDRTWKAMRDGSVILLILQTNSLQRLNYILLSYSFLINKN